MLELIQITNDPAFARRCDALEGFRIMVDLERLGKAERQAGRNTFISEHQAEDIAPVRASLSRAQLMVRVNPPNPSSAAEVESVLARGAQQVMLPMFTRASEVREFCAVVAGRAPVVLLLENAGALATIDEWIATPGLREVFVGLNDLHLSLGNRFMFEPVALGHVDRVAQACARHGLRFGFGGIARLDEGLLPGRDVLAEHLRLGSKAVILSRTFHRSDSSVTFEEEVARLRETEAALARRSASEVEQDRVRIWQAIARIGAKP